MPRTVTFTVVPKLPPRLQPLMDIANNIWWCWDPGAVGLFFRIDRDLWTDTNQNPKQLLGAVSQARLEVLAKDDSFLNHMDDVVRRLKTYIESGTWKEKNPSAPEEFGVAYLSAEFGLQESISIYSGGLGVLAGDHLKSSSDLGIPLVGIGLLYREGYFHQYLNADGWQQELYPHNDFYNMMIDVVHDDEGNPVIIDVEYPDRVVKARVWRCRVGRVPLYLLDCDIDQNIPEDREITARLYQGDRDMRIRQEIMLGVGGVKIMRTLNLKPTTYHMNEGHSAFMTLQRVKELMARDALNFWESVDAVRAGSVFTTHTPVPAGNDMFVPELITRYFTKYCSEVGISLDQLLALGRQNPFDAREPFCMTVLALKLSSFSNGVSELHGVVARAMWERTWDGVPIHEIPVTSITNGIHIPFWISHDLAGLYDLAKILVDEKMPVQFIIAGKAHPQDTQAKELIRRIIHYARQPEVRSRVVFVEDYDINVARYMVQGVDCWLNTPRRPMEASGTSGMKAASNGALNISVVDGWWGEAEILGENGWSIGRGESYTDPNEQDQVESEALYEILEKEVVPMFYDRGRDGLPRDWIHMMKTAIRTICPVFNTNRMVQEYANRFYIPAAIRRATLRADDRKRSKELTAWKQRVQGIWSNVRFTNVESGQTENLFFGSILEVTADLYLDTLKPEDVDAEIYYGDLDSLGRIPKGKTVPMECIQTLENNVYRFRGGVPCLKTGQQGLMVRAIPSHRDLATKHEMALITWA
ncbi:MAG: alpha-glucan family phosphorylase [Candidatus Hydrogenedentes bacterium]|nr:alpha-glucan family phosphorylase [Candidatus Hydrogenedentota bacterium]